MEFVGIFSLCAFIIIVCWLIIRDNQQEQIKQQNKKLEKTMRENKRIERERIEKEKQVIEEKILNDLNIVDTEPLQSEILKWVDMIYNKTLSYEKLYLLYNLTKNILTEDTHSIFKEPDLYISSQGLSIINNFLCKCFIPWENIISINIQKDNNIHYSIPHSNDLKTQNTYSTGMIYNSGIAIPINHTDITHNTITTYEQVFKEQQSGTLFIYTFSCAYSIPLNSLMSSSSVILDFYNKYKNEECNKKEISYL